MFRANIIYISAVLLFTPVVQGEVYAKEDILSEFVAELPRGTLGIPYYWLEMKSLVGWENMVLFYGYADNRPICNRLLDIAVKDAPDRQFRCSAAN